MSVDASTVVARVNGECGPRPKGEACARLRRELEAALLQALLELRASGNAVDIELYRAAALAESPYLAVLGLRTLARNQPLTEGDQKLVLRAVESPYPSVRMTALGSLDRENADHYYARLDPAAKYDYSDWLSATEDEVADVPGVPVYPGARYRFFASGPSRAFYTTRDPQEKVLAFYTRAGKKDYSADELGALASKQPDVNLMMELAKKDPDAVQAEITKFTQAATGNTTIDLGTTGVVNARYVVLDKVEFAGVMKPTRVLVIYKDELLGRTAVVVPR